MSFHSASVLPPTTSHSESSRTHHDRQPAARPRRHRGPDGRPHGGRRILTGAGVRQVHGGQRLQRERVALQARAARRQRHGRHAAARAPAPARAARRRQQHAAACAQGRAQLRGSGTSPRAAPPGCPYPCARSWRAPRGPSWPAASLWRRWACPSPRCTASRPPPAPWPLSAAVPRTPRRCSSSVRSIVPRLTLRMPSRGLFDTILQVLYWYVL